MNNRRKKALILAVWLVLLGISGVVLAITEGSLTRQKMLHDLGNEAKAVSGEMQRIVRAEVQVQREMDSAQMSRVKALVFALEEKGEILQTDPLLNDFAIDSGVGQLIVYSREERNKPAPDGSAGKVAAL